MSCLTASTMSHYNIAIHTNDSVNITALGNLPTLWRSGSDTYTVFSGTPTRQIVDGEYLSNTDYSIRHHVQNHDYWCAPYSLGGGGCDFTRMKKSYQQAWLRDNIDQADFLPIPTWSDPRSASIKPSTVYLIKPEHGARGIGTMVFNTDFTTPAKLIKMLNTSETAYRSKDGTNWQQVQETFELSLKGGDVNGFSIANYVSKRDKYPGEGIEALLSGEGMVLQEQVEGIVAEYRFITNEDGKVVYAIRRTITPVVTHHSGINFSQGCGNNEHPRDAAVGSDLEELYLTSTLHTAVQGVNNLKLPLHSFDIFIKPRHEGAIARWGIFEFCPQFGVEAVPIRIITEAGKRFVEKMVAGKLTSNIVASSGV